MHTARNRIVRLVAAASIAVAAILVPLLAAPVRAEASPRHHPGRRHGLERELARVVDAYDAANVRLWHLQVRLSGAAPARRPALLRARLDDLIVLARGRARMEKILATDDRLYRTLTGRRRAYLDAIATRAALRRQTAVVAATTAIAAARSVLGAPYVFGAAGPNAFDCSGLTRWAYALAGVALPHSADAQYASLPRVPLSRLRPGDIVYYGDHGPHVALYVGGGTIIHATHPGLGGGVREDPLYRYDRPWGAVRPT